MTKEEEKEVLVALYDRLLDAVTHQPTVGENRFSDSDTMFHFSTNSAVNTKDFLDLVTPSRPNGDWGNTEIFSRMVDKIGPISPNWDAAQGPLSDAYINLVTGINTRETLDPEFEEMYQEVLDFLTPMVTKEKGFGKNKKKVTAREPGAEYTVYENNMDDYESAVISYKLAFNTYADELDASLKTFNRKFKKAKDEDEKELLREEYDISKRTAQRGWQTAEPAKKNAIKKAFRKLSVGDGESVEEALEVLRTTKNNAIRSVLVAAQDSVSDEKKVASNMGQGAFLPSYPSPSNWAEGKGVAFTKLTISGENEDTKNSRTKHKYEIDASYDTGLWSVSASSKGEFENINKNTKKSSISIEAEVGKVTINRPWLNENIFKIKGWEYNAGIISNGLINLENKKNLLPMIPVAFIVAKNVVIKGAFSEQEQEKIKKEVEAKAEVGYGPFKVSGSYGYSKEEEKFKSSVNEGTLRIDGMQILGWISKVVPKCG